MSELIVDFPQDQDAGRAAKCARRPSVRFLGGEVRVYPADDASSSSSEKYYTDADYKKFKHARRRDVLDAHRRYLARSADGNGCAYAGCELTGLENLLTPKLIQTAISKRHECRNAVLDEQERQFAEGCRDPERLARASRKTSRWGAERSRKIGLMNQLIR